ncbi:MAG TPA: CDP-diacylglycerol--glycerol-3-phosphate 3-phosphatidyltransferase [Actinomycetota bacterium]|nr:CDP-diacylglycerol--glycerol-3-phosphate 3-phosphatidyltransferase [Actinomycetota bacterium]
MTRPAGSTAVLMRITYLRIVLVPAVMACILAGDDVDGAYVTGATLFVVAAGTDFVDGFLARRWRLTTTLGSFLDTTADKLLVSGALVALVAVGRASPWAATIVVGRELLIMGLRGVVASGGEVVPPSIWGKLKATVQFVAIGLAIVRVEDEIGPLHLDEYAMLAAVVVTIMSAVEYLSRYASALKSDAPR